MDEVERALAALQEARERSEREAQVRHARNHQALAQEVLDQFQRLSISRNEAHLAAGGGRGGPPAGLLSQDELDERKRAILARGGFRV